MKTHYAISNGNLTLCGQWDKQSVAGKENIGQVSCEKCKKVILTNVQEVELKNNQLVIKGEH